MFGIRLLELIRESNTLPYGKGILDIASSNSEANSIINYINKILTTRQGSVQIADDFGVPDYTTIVYESLENAVEIISKSLTQTLTKYEPRLNNVKINFIGRNDNNLSLVFSIDATLTLNSNHTLNFQTIFNADGISYVKMI